MDSQRLEPNDQYTVLDASVDRQEVTVGEAVELTVEVENTAEERSEFALQVRNDGRLERTETFTVPANETTTLRMSYRVTEPGDHTIEANRIEAGTVRAVAADGESAEALFGGGMLPVLVVLVLAGGAPTLVGYARYRGWTTSDRPGHPPSRATARGPAKELTRTTVRIHVEHHHGQPHSSQRHGSAP